MVVPSLSFHFHVIYRDNYPKLLLFPGARACVRGRTWARERAGVAQGRILTGKLAFTTKNKAKIKWHWVANPAKSPSFSVMMGVMNSESCKIGPLGPIFHDTLCIVMYSPAVLRTAVLYIFVLNSDVGRRPTLLLGRGMCCIAVHSIAMLRIAMHSTATQGLLPIHRPSAYV